MDTKQFNVIENTITYNVIENNITYNVIEHKYHDEQNAWSERYWFYEKKLHRVNYPAVEFISGYIVWYKHGLCHREDGAAVISGINGIKQYYLNGKQYLNISSDDEWIIFNLIT